MLMGGCGSRSVQGFAVAPKQRHIAQNIASNAPREPTVRIMNPTVHPSVMQPIWWLQGAHGGQVHPNQQQRQAFQKRSAQQAMQAPSAQHFKTNTQQHSFPPSGSVLPTSGSVLQQTLLVADTHQAWVTAQLQRSSLHTLCCSNDQNNPTKPIVWTRGHPVNMAAALLSLKQRSLRRQVGICQTGVQLAHMHPQPVCQAVPLHAARNMPVRATAQHIHPQPPLHAVALGCAPQHSTYPTALPRCALPCQLTSTGRLRTFYHASVSHYWPPTTLPRCTFAR